MHKIFPAQVTGPIIVLIGLILAPVAIGNLFGPAAGTPKAYGWQQFLVGAITFATALVVKIVFKKKLISIFPVLTALLVGYATALILGLVDLTFVSSTPIVGLPAFVLPNFNYASAYSMVVPIALVTIIEHFGDVLAIGNVVGQDFVDDPGLHRTLAGDGIATSVAALIGGPANTTYSENTGTIALTGVKDPVIMRIAAMFAILLSFSPLISSLIGSVPGPVIGGVSILLFGMISAIGIKNMVDAKLDLGNPKNLIIVALILVMGLGNASISIGPVELKGLGLAALTGIILNLILYFPQIFLGKTND
jgi:uracil permease